MLKKICGFLSTILLIVLFALAVLLIAPSFLGMKSLAVLSGSMEPKIPVGSIVYVEDVDPNTLQVGDVITYSIGKSTMVTHRVEEIDFENQSIITKGDANEVQDANPVAFTQVVGKMKAHVPYLGYISIYVRTPLGIVAACVILIVVVLLTFLPEVFKKEDTDSETTKNTDVTDM